MSQEEVNNPASSICVAHRTGVPHHQAGEQKPPACLHREGFIKKQLQDTNSGVCRHAVFDGLHYDVSSCFCVAAPTSSLTINPTFSTFQQVTQMCHRVGAAAQGRVTLRRTSWKGPARVQGQPWIWELVEELVE